MSEQDIIKTNIAKNIKKYRKLRNLEQHELAILALGYPREPKNAAQKIISRFETALQEPKCSELIQIAKTLKVKCTRLCSNNETS